MQLYTIIADYQLGTYLSQYETDKPEQALQRWIKEFDLNIIEGIGENKREEIIKGFSEEELTPIATLSNVWCASGSVNNELLLIHIVKTNAI